MNLKRMQVLLGDVWSILRGCVCDRGVSLRVRRCEEVVAGVTVAGDRHGQGGTRPCKQAKRGRPEGVCGVIFGDFGDPHRDFFFFSPKMTRFDIILK